MSSCNALPHKRLLRTEPHSFPAVSQLEFSSHFLKGVRAMFAVRWLLQSQLCFYRCPMCEWQNNQKKQLTTAVLSQSSPIQNLWDKQQQQESRANVMHNMDALINLPAGYSSGNHSSIIYKIAFLWISTLHMYSNTISTSGTLNSSYTSNSWHYSCPRSVYFRSIVFLLVV